MESILESTKLVVERSKEVKVVPQKIEEFSRWIKENRPKLPPWENTFHFKGSPKATLSYILILDSLNFCFWYYDNKKRWNINGISGYYALAYAIKKAVLNDIPILNFNYLKDISFKDFKEVLRGGKNLLLLEDRWKIIRELGKTISSKFEGDPLKLIEDSEGSVINLIDIIIKNLPSFRDEAYYEGKRVCFYKRAQLLCSDIYLAFNGKGIGGFRDMHRLTAMADYKLPQVLYHLGILEYSRSLKERIKRREIIPSKSPEEIEIRANTIWAVEMIKERLKEMGENYLSYEIDCMLWNMGQDKRRYGRFPYHRTITIYY